MILNAFHKKLDEKNDEILLRACGHQQRKTTTACRLKHKLNRIHSKDKQKQNVQDMNRDKSEQKQMYRI